MRRGLLLFVLGFSILLYIGGYMMVRADELSDINAQLANLQSALNSSKQATELNERELAKLNQQLNGIKAQVDKIEADIAEKEDEIRIGEAKLIKQKELLDQRVASFYKQKGREKDSLMEILISDNFSAFLKQFTYQQNLLNNDREAIVRVVLLVQEIEERKIALEDEQNRLLPIKETIAQQSTLLEGEVLSAKKQQESIKKEISALSARQKEIVAQRQASLNIPQSAGSAVGGCSDDRGVDPGFGNAYAFFTFGVPNRVGMSQYGAKERAEDGQNVEQILSFYYNAELKKDYSSDITINVNGHGSYNIEEYVKRVYEMSESWPYEVLKAQVVAARTYALSYTGNGARSICTTQQCQVFKSEPKTGAWARAVDETRGWVLVNGGNPIGAFYSMVHGGYTYTTSDIGWNPRPWTKRSLDARGNVSSFGDLLSNAYGKSSPWFYCGWGWRDQYNHTAWLKSEEVADIANVILLARRLSGDETNHLSQVDKPNKFGTETWDMGKVRDELRSRGGNPFSSVSNVSISADFGTGFTNGVTIQGDAGSETFSGSEFQQWFNLRAPANIQIVGPLFNVERH